MGAWCNIGFALSDNKSSEVLQILEEYDDVNVYEQTDQTLKVSSMRWSSKQADKIVRNVIDTYRESIDGVIVVTANDVADTAEGSIYNVENNSISVESSQYANRRERPEVSFGGMSVSTKNHVLFK